ncbi:MAG: class I adenylate-forming enzyme family protein [Acidimicrobiales bacterium]
MSTPEEIRAQLTGPGGAFEVVVEEVNGHPTEVYKDRLGSLREVAAVGLRRGDEQLHLVHGERRIGFATFVCEANSVSRAFAEQYGIVHGDRVAVLAQNSPEWCTTFWATVDVGAVLVGLNGWWTTDEIVYGLQDSGARVLVADAKRFERIASELDSCPSLDAVFLTDADPLTFAHLAEDPRIHRFTELTSSPTFELPTTPIDEDDAAAILYTSGTTGRPKGAISTHRNMVANLQNTLFSGLFAAMTSGEAAATKSGQTVALFTSPLFHVSGLHSGIVTSMLAGIRLVMLEGRFDPGEALEIIQRERVSLWATVPTMVWRVCEHPSRHDYDTTSVTTVAFGGSPSAEELQRMVRETFPSIRGGASNVYGLTETSSAATVLSPSEALERPGTVGRAVPTVRIKISDGTDRALPPGEAGEVLVTGPTIMAGYWGKPDETARSIDAEGWLRTGDIGMLDAEGYLTITDRAKDMIIRGGENIYCVEIENRLVEHPAVADAAVIGVPHHSLGEEVKAVVQVERGKSISEAEVRSWVAETLGPFKVPAHVALTADKLPRNASGKLLKNVLRGEGEVSFAETM